MVLDAVSSNGKQVSFQDKGKPSSAAIASETKLTLAGAEVKADQIRPGMSCELTYFGDKGQAIALACD